jgi:peptide/nickel transport system substrate-binding protein
MAAKKFIVELDAEERARLDALISKGKASAKAILTARILLKADVAEGGPGWLDAQIVEALDTNLTMVSRVREAFELALDRPGIVQVVMDGEAAIGNQWVAPDNPYYAKNMPVPKRDVARAKALLAEAGVPNPSFTLMTPTTSDAQKIAQVVQAMVKEAGFDVKIQSTEFATSLDLADKGQYDAYVLAWSGRADPDGNVFSFDACKQPLNYAGYCKPEVDEILNKSRTTRDPAERRKLFEQLAATALKDRPIVYLYHRHWLWAYTAKLSGLRAVPENGGFSLSGSKLFVDGAMAAGSFFCSR